MDVKLPNLGEGADSGVVVSLLVKDGDTVAAGQTVLELETGKAVAPIPASAAGKVARLRVKVGDKVSAGAVLFSLEGAEGAAAPATPAAPAPKSGKSGKAAAPAPESEAAPESAPDEPAPADSPFPPPASPTLRRLAVELGIDLRKIKGSEHGGRIVMADLRAYLQRLQKQAAAPRTAPAPKPAAGGVDFAQWGPITKRPQSTLRQVIAQRMVESCVTVPHVHQFDEADITDAEALRKKFAPAYEAKGAKLTFTAFALKAVVGALKKHPDFNSSIDDAANEVVVKAYYHIGLAVDTEAGLLVPVIRNADTKSLLELSQDIAAFAAKARDRKLGLDEMKGGTFTISNQGGIGGAHFTPIINKPEVGILGLGRGALKPVVRHGKIEPRLMLPLCLGYDHRLIDGGRAARFIVDLVAAFGAFTDADVKL